MNCKLRIVWLLYATSCLLHTLDQRSATAQDKIPILPAANVQSTTDRPRVFVVDRSVVHYGVRQGASKKLFEVREQVVFHLAKDSLVHEYAVASMLLSFGKVTKPESGLLPVRNTWKLDPNSGLNAARGGNRLGLFPI